MNALVRWASRDEYGRVPVWQRAVAVALVSLAALGWLTG